MDRKTFVQIPINYPAGGIKVAHQLVNLFIEKGYESYIVLPDRVYPARWLINPAPTINTARMKKICQREDIVIDNWIDKDTVFETSKLNARTKIFYLQGCTFYKSKKLIGDEFLKKDLGYTHFWVVSQDSLNYLKNKYNRIKKWYLIHPYLEFDLIERYKKNQKRKKAILCFSRKGSPYIKTARFFYGNKINFNVVSKEFTEEESYKLFLSNKFFLHTAAGVNNRFFSNLKETLKGRMENTYSVIKPSGYREGFPLPAAEAAACGCIVIGFAMGGGLEWMRNDNCFLAKDRSYVSILKKTKEALFSSEEKLNTTRENALKTVTKFNKESTWHQISNFLNDI